MQYATMRNLRLHSTPFELVGNAQESLKCASVCTILNTVVLI